MDNWCKLSPLSLDFKLRSPSQVGHWNCRQINWIWGKDGRKMAGLPRVKNKAGTQRWVTMQEWSLTGVLCGFFWGFLVPGSSPWWCVMWECSVFLLVSLKTYSYFVVSVSSRRFLLLATRRVMAKRFGFCHDHCYASQSQKYWDPEQLCVAPRRPQTVTPMFPAINPHWWK